MSLEALIDDYCSCWSELDWLVRVDRLSALVTNDITYVDPSVEVSGVENFARHIATVSESRPGSQVLRTTQIQQHHGIVRVGWHMVLPDGSALPDGIDIIWWDEESNKLTDIVGFFGSTKPLETGGR